MVETSHEMKLKQDFVEKFSQLSNKMSKQRTDTLRHYFDFCQKQKSTNIEDDESLVRDTNRLPKRIKYKPGGNPSKDRVIIREKIDLTLEQIHEIRKYSHMFCLRNIEKIDQDLKERTQKLMLPIIKN
jgi:hypothetical protein